MSEDTFADEVSSGMARLDRIPAVLVSKRSRARKQVTVRLEAAEVKSDAHLTQTERGNAVAIRHLSLDAMLEISQQLEAELIKKENARDRGIFEAAIYVSGDGACSERSLGIDMWDSKLHRRVETEAEWSKCIDAWDRGKGQRLSDVEASASAVL